MQGMTNFSIKDEAFYSMTWASRPRFTCWRPPSIAATPSAQRRGHAGETVPQIWTYENQLDAGADRQPYRAFVWMQGHFYANFSNPQIQPMLLRGIAWAAHRSVDTLMTERPARGGGRGTNDAQRAGPGEGRTGIGSVNRWIG